MPSTQPKQDDCNKMPELQVCIAEALYDAEAVLSNPSAFKAEEISTLRDQITFNLERAQEAPNVTCRTWFLAVMLMGLSVGMVPTASGLEPSLDIKQERGGEETEDAADTDQAVAPGTRGWYVGGGVGGSDDKGLREDDTGFKVFGGYRPNKYLALEGAIVFLGEFGPANAFSKDGLSLEFVGILPIGQRFELFGKLGLFFWEITADVLCTPFGSGFVCAEDADVDDGTDATYGVGFQTHFTGRWGGRLEWQRFTDVGTDDVDLLSVNVIYGF